MEGVDPKQLEYVLGLIKDGFIFEKFASEFLSAVMGYNFIPQGGLKDKGIDGLEHVFYRDGYEKQLYQYSIDKNPQSKLMSTIVKLDSNKIEYDQLVYVTNQSFKDQDSFLDEVYARTKKQTKIFDANWFESNINKNQQTVISYRIFVDSHLHEFNKPGKSYIVGDMVSDPRLFIFLRQQLDSSRKDHNLDATLADTLILYALQDTDPDKQIVKNKDQILEDIKKHIKFNPALLREIIIDRLEVLSERPRKIQYHKQLGGYCFPYETRLEIQKKNIEDSSLHENFRKSVGGRLKLYLKEKDVSVKDCVGLIEMLLNKIFYEQGMEFSDFVLKGENQDAIEKFMPDIISSTVDDSPVINKNKQDVKLALLMTIREIVYRGESFEKEFLRRLSNTYMLLFLVQCDPKLSMFFSSMASKLNIYVGTSIIIPALSEYYVSVANRRHWSLLKGAHEAGVKLVINENILDELVHHFRYIATIFSKDYHGNEHLYTDRSELVLIRQIIIRAYFYARLDKKTSTFNDFLSNFIDPLKIYKKTLEDEIIMFLKEEFGIEYCPDESKGICIDKGQEDKLFEGLKSLKKSENNAKIDAKIILAIYDFRRRSNEKADKGIFGYKTWWLSKDVVTHKTLCEIFEEDMVSCYIRPDFLYNYISLAPKTPEVDSAFKNLFPTLVGVNISFRLPLELTEAVHQQLVEHGAKNPAQLKRTLGSLTEQLIHDPKYWTRLKIKQRFDDELK